MDKVKIKAVLHKHFYHLENETWYDADKVVEDLVSVCKKDIETTEPQLKQADVMAMLPDEDVIKKMAQQYMRSNRTIGGGDAGWIEAAYKDGIRDLVKILKGN